MNSDGGELEKPNSNRIFLPSSAIRSPQVATNFNSAIQQKAALNNAVDLAYHNNTINASMMSSSSANGSMGDSHINNRDFTLNSKYNEKPQERYVWEMHSRSPNITPVSTVLNSPDLSTDVQYTLQNHPKHHQIRLGRSPGSQFEQHNILPQGLASPGSPTDVGKAGGQCLRDGEIVVFDDIDTNWMNRANSSTTPSNHRLISDDGSTQSYLHNEQRPQQQQQHEQQQQQIPQHHYHHYQYFASNHNNNEDILKVTKMIGQLPIAEYEKSPRRFGNHQQQQQQHQQQQSTMNAKTPSSGAKLFPKRQPGFPQRVSPIVVNTVEQEQTLRYNLMQEQQRQQLEQQRQQLEQQQQQQQQQQYHVSQNNTVIGGEDNKSLGNLIDIDATDDNLGNGGVYGINIGGGGGVVVNDDGIMSCNSNFIGVGVGSFDTNIVGKVKTPTFDYLYEFSETRKVLEEFFKANPDEEKRLTEFTESGEEIVSCDAHQEIERQIEEDKHIEQAYIGQRLARIPKDELLMVHRSPKKQCDNISYNDQQQNDIELYIDSNSRSSGDLADTELEANIRRHSRNFTLSPETTDYDSNCGDLDSLSNDINCTTDYGKLYTSMPVLEDGLSSGHASDTENNLATIISEKQIKQDMDEELNEKNEIQPNCMNNDYQSKGSLNTHENCSPRNFQDSNGSQEQNVLADLVDLVEMRGNGIGGEPQQIAMQNQQQQMPQQQFCDMINGDSGCCNTTASLDNSNGTSNDINFDPIYAASIGFKQSPPPPPAPVPHRQLHLKQQQQSDAADIQEAMKEIRSALQRAKKQPEKLKFCDEVLPPDPDSPVWVPRKSSYNNNNSTSNINNNNNQNLNRSITPKTTHCPGEEEEPDTDLETDRLLGQQRLDEQAYYDDKTIWPKTSRIGGDSNEHSPTTSDITLLTNKALGMKPQSFTSATIRQGIGTSLTPTTPERCQIIGSNDVALTSPEKIQFSKSPSGSIKSLKDSANSDKKAKTRNKEALLDPAVLIEGVLFRARYLGSTQLVCEGQPTKTTRMMQAEEAVSRIKAPEGESQPSTEVDLFISTEKIMVLNTDLKEIMMDHALRTISYIADIGDLVVLMARRRFVPSDSCNADNATLTTVANADNATTQTPTIPAEAADTNNTNNEGTPENGGSINSKEQKDASNNTNGTGGTNGGGGGSNKHSNRTPKMICHVFESDEAQFIAQSIGQAFQVAYMEFLKANGIEDHSFVKEMDYQEVLNSQEIFGDELEIFAKKELQKEVVVPKAKGEILGVVIVESGWGSMLPTVVIANLMSAGAAARCGQLNIGDQLIAINGMSLVGLPLSTCQNYIRNAKNQTAVKFTVVPCPPVVEVKIKRPNTKYQLGFSVQNGVICSLLRGGIAERGGVRVGHRIIEINNQSVVAVPHEKIVNLLATSVGEILMKTMPTSMFRLLTGQENPIYI